MENLVSIITPAFNCSKHILDTYYSVVNQEYKKIEWIIVDDNSSDNTVSIIRNNFLNDERIVLIENNENLGAAISRNKAISMAKGDYIAFLDADDLWEPNKLSAQVAFMKKFGILFSCVSYKVIDDNGKSLNKRVIMKEKLNYEGFLLNNLIQTVGVMIDIRGISKEICMMPNLRRRQDAATWLKILKQGHECYGMPDILCSYRRTEGSLSSNKFKSVKGVWSLYRDVEKLPLWFSLKCFAKYATLAVWKRIYIGGGLEK